MKRMAFAIILLSLFLNSHQAFCQKIRTPGSRTDVKGLAGGETFDRNAALFLRMPKLTGDYLIGARDELKIEVVGQDALTRTMQSLKVDNSGEIAIPFLGRVAVADLTASQVEEKIASLLISNKLLLTPEVLVYITDYQAKPVYILGEVDNPGEYIMSQQMTLMELILMAGGIDPNADRFGYLHRMVSAEGADWHPGRVVDKPEMPRPGWGLTKIDLAPLKAGGVLHPDIMLRKGDVFAVPTRTVSRYFVVGEVKTPGAFDIPETADRSIKVTQAIAQAGGPGKAAKMEKGFLVRYEKGERTERNVNFAQILMGKKQDFEVQPDDIIFIPGSNVKTLGYELLGMIPNSVQTSATRQMER